MKNKKQNTFKVKNLNENGEREGEMTKRKGTAPFKELKSQKVFSIMMILTGLFIIFVTAPFIIIKIGTLAVISGIVGIILFFIGLFYFLDAFFN